MNSMKEKSLASWSRSLLSMALALVALVLGAGRSEASLEKLRGDISKFAKDLKKWLDEEGEKGIVTLSSFQNLPELGTNPSSGLGFILKQELVRAGVPLRRTANYGITGKLSRYPATGPIDKIKEFTIALEVVGGGKPMPVIHKDLKITAERRDREVMDLFKGHDEVKTSVTRFYKGPYGAEILVNDKPREAKIVDGIPFVVLKPNEEYTIRLVNESAQEAAVWVGIDGLSMFAFSEDKTPEGNWRDFRVLVPGKEDGEKEGALSLKGWYFHNRENGSRKFRVTEYPESAAYLKNLSPGNVGMITLQFWETYPAGTAPRGVGTGMGPAFTQKWTVVKRDLGKLMATITIRYDKN